MNEINKILNPDEKVIWEGKPQFLPYYIGVLVPSIMMGIFLSLFFSPFGYFLLQIFKESAPTNIILISSIFIVPFILMALWLLIGVPIYSWLVYKYIFYIISDKRVIFQRGLIGRDFDYVDYDKIENSAVSVGIIDKLFGKNSGTIKVYANRLDIVGSGEHKRTVNKPLEMLHITDPYEIFELIKKTSFDVKTDIEYPNVLRPDENKGYSTEYKFKKD